MRKITNEMGKRPERSPALSCLSPSPSNLPPHPLLRQDITRIYARCRYRLHGNIIRFSPTLCLVRKSKISTPPTNGSKIADLNPC